MNRVRGMRDARDVSGILGLQGVLMAGWILLAGLGASGAAGISPAPGARAGQEPNAGVTAALSSPANLQGFDNSAGDFDGDGVMDPTVYNEEVGMWLVLPSRDWHNLQTWHFGAPGWTALMADFDGDAYADPAIYCRATGQWLARLSASGYGEVSVLLGGEGYLPFTGDYDDDGRADPGVYESASGLFWVMMSSAGYQFQHAVIGGPGYAPASADFDGDGKTDPAVFRADDVRYNILYSSLNYREVSVTVGLDTEDSSLGVGTGPFLAVPFDYDGDRKADPAVYSFSTEEKRYVFAYFALLSSALYQTTRPFPHLAQEDCTFSTTEPAPGDYDGDGICDYAVVWPNGNDLTWRMWCSERDYSGHTDEGWGWNGFRPVKRW